MTSDLEYDASEEDFEGILGSFSEDSVSAQCSLQFQPWHRPHKQYVRDNMWIRETINLLRDLYGRELQDLSKVVSGGSIRYLTLPGNDCLDIRAMGPRVYDLFHLKLLWYGFDVESNKNKTLLQSKIFELKRKPYIDKNSNTYYCDIRVIGRKLNDRVRNENTNYVLEDFKKQPPFDIINLDLCANLACKHRHISQYGTNYFAVIESVLIKQSKRNKKSLLFVTTKMDSDSAEHEDAVKLQKLAQEVFDRCRDYADSFVKCWGANGAEDCKLQDYASYEEHFMLGVTQWIIRQAISCRLKPKVKSFMVYHTGVFDGEDDIVSFAIELSPVSSLQVDASGLIESPDMFNAQNLEDKVSSVVPCRVFNRIHVDAVLGDDKEEMTKCIDSTKALLEEVGYDTDAYEKWLLEEKTASQRL